MLKHRIAGRQCLGKTGRLCSSDGSAAGAAMGEDEGTRRVQLNRRSRARR
jgi:hypothetical protein